MVEKPTRHWGFKPKTECECGRPVFRKWHGYKICKVCYEIETGYWKQQAVANRNFLREAQPQ